MPAASPGLPRISAAVKVHIVKTLSWRLYEPVAMVLGLLLLAFFCIAWTPFAVLLNGILPARAATRVGRDGIRLNFRAYVFLLRVLCGCRFDLGALKELARKRGKDPLIVVANHPSLLDAVVFTAFLPNAVCIMKAGVLRNPLMGPGARVARYIANDAPLYMVRTAIAELEQGACLIVFPESTRTHEPPVGHCEATAGIIAAHAKVPVQIVTIEMSSPYLGKRWPLWRPPRLPLHYRVQLGARLETVERPRAFGQEMEHYFRTHLDPRANRMPGEVQTP